MAISLGNSEIGKISLGNIEISKVSLGAIEVWSGGFDGDFAKVGLWEAGKLTNGAPVANNNEARTKAFYTIPAVGLNLLSMTSSFRMEVHFYNSDYSFISTVYVSALGNITIPSGAIYYKLTFFKGLGAQRYPMNIPVFVPEANIKVNAE